MNDTPYRLVSARSLRPLLALSALLAAVSLSCSVGQLLTGRQGVIPTATKTPRATFTPLPGALTPRPAATEGVRGVLPPGVTAQPPGGPAVAEGTPDAASGGTTNLVLYATASPAPSPTPEPLGPTATPTRDVETNRPTRAAGPRAVPTPYVVIQAEKAIGRRGPATTFERIGEAKQGEQLFILGRTADNAWWHVCCIANQPAWVAADLVTALGPTETAPVLTPAPTPPPTAPPPPRPTATAVPTPGLPFDIASGPEFPIKRDNGILTIWVKVYEGPSDNQTTLAGYILKVFRDGVDVSDGNQSFGDAPFNRTYPEGDFKYNLKFEKNNAGEADWEIYLARPGGFRVSPVSKFTTKGDSYRNLVVFVAYWLAR